VFFCILSNSQKYHKKRISIGTFETSVLICFFLVCGRYLKICWALAVALCKLKSRFSLKQCISKFWTSTYLFKNFYSENWRMDPSPI